jgi:hypothetical protein
LLLELVAAKVLMAVIHHLTPQQLRLVAVSLA